MSHNYPHHHVRGFLESLGVENFHIFTEDRFCPRSISETKRTIHFIILGNQDHEVSITKEGYDEKFVGSLKNTVCLEKEFEAEKVRIWIYFENNGYEYLTDFVENYIYLKYSQTLI